MLHSLARWYSDNRAGRISAKSIPPNWVAIKDSETPDHRVVAYCDRQVAPVVAAAPEMYDMLVRLNEYSEFLGDDAMDYQDLRTLLREIDASIARARV